MKYMTSTYNIMILMKIAGYRICDTVYVNTYTCDCVYIIYICVYIYIFKQYNTKICVYI